MYRRNSNFMRSVILFVVIVVFFAGCSIYNDRQENYYNTDNMESSTFEEKVTTSEAYSTTSNKKSTKSTEESKDTNNATDVTSTENSDSTDYQEYSFRNDYLLESHYEKHGIEMGFSSSEDYQEAASMVINNPEALHKIEAEDGDDVYYLEETNEFVILSTDGYIRTYFEPDSGIDYYNRQ